jgi:hypothetical protein
VNALLIGCAGGGDGATVGPALRLATAPASVAPNVLVGRVVDRNGKPVAEAKLRY